LKLSGTKITGEEFAKGIHLPYLEILNLGSCHLTDRGLMKILDSSGSKLIKLNLSCTQTTGEEFAKEIHLPDLEILNSSGSKLIELKLSGTKITGEEFAKEIHLPDLEILDLTICRHLTDRGLQKIVDSSGGKLKVLHISDRDSGLQEFIMESYPGLRLNAVIRYM
jgi:hypothetical protein